MNSLKPLLKKLRNIARYLFVPFILKGYWQYRKLDMKKRFTVNAADFFPNIKDKTITTGFDRHYVYHTSWAARVLREIVERDQTFKKHVDISSSLYFSGIVSAFISVEFYDYRPAELLLSNLKSFEGNLMSLPFKDKSVNSISCMHTIEHIGLGRYGDQIDPDGDIKAFNELQRVVSTKGNLLIVLPMGKPRIQFNAHRIYGYEQVMRLIDTDSFSLKEFSYIPEREEDGGLIRNADIHLPDKDDYGCGCFWFVRK